MSRRDTHSMSASLLRHFHTVHMPMSVDLRGPTTHRRSETQSEYKESIYIYG